MEIPSGAGVKSKRSRGGLTLSAKFIIIIALLLSAVFVVVTILLVNTNTKTLRSNLNRQSQAFSQLATTPIGDIYVIYQDSGRSRIRQEVAKFTELDPNIANVAVVDLDGKIMFSQTDNFPLSVPATAAKSFEQTSIAEPDHDLIHVVQPYIEDFGAHRYTLVYSVSTASIDRAIRDVVYRILAVAAVFLTASVFGLYLLLNRFFLRPVKLVSDAASAVSTGDLERQIQLDSHDELGNLATAVNSMAESLKADIAKFRELDQLKSEFMVIASHYLRTPITVISGNLELLDLYELPEKVQKLVRSLRGNTEKLHTLAEDILMIARLEGGIGVGGEAETLDLSAALHQLAAEVALKTQAKQIHFTAEIPTHSVLVRTNEQYIKKAVGNLIDNALKFTKEGGSISLSLASNDNSAVIRISDSGIGISKSEIDKLFTKFHRGTSTMVFDYEGTGIGLYLTKLLVEGHGGTISAASSEGRGSTFTINLPRVQTHATLQKN